MKKELNQNLIAAIVIIVLFMGAGLLYYNNNQKKLPGMVPPDEAANKALAYIDQVALQGQAETFLIEAIEENGLYKIRFKIEEQESLVYITKDAKLLFGPPIKLSEEISASSNSSGQEFPKADTPKVQLFVMSYCPYGNQAEELMMPVANLLKGKADIELHYVIYSNYGGGGGDYCLDKESKYCSLHGIQELNQDVRELCVQKYQPDKLWDFAKEANSGCNSKNIDSCWEGVADKVGVNINKVKNCQANEALSLLAEEVELNDKYGISGSPQLVINDVEYNGSRTSDSFKKAICSTFNSQPDECFQTLSGEAGSASGECE